VAIALAAAALAAVPATSTAAVAAPVPAAVPAAAATAAPGLVDVSPVAVTYAGFTAEVATAYVRGTDRRLWWRDVNPRTGTPITAWAPAPGGTIGSGPDADLSSDSADGPATQVLVARSEHNSVIMRDRTAAGFGRWIDLGGVITTAPAIVGDYLSDMRAVFARGTDGALWYRRYADGSWEPWRSLRGGITAQPAATNAEAHTISIYARGTDGKVWNNALSPDWRPWDYTYWRSLGGERITSAVDGRESSVERVLAYRGPAGSLRVNRNGRITDYGGALTSAPTLVGGEARPTVAARGTDRALWLYLNGRWRSLGGQSI
jgi:hypothetical protein